MSNKIAGRKQYPSFVLQCFLHRVSLLRANRKQRYIKITNFTVLQAIAIRAVKCKNGLDVLYLDFSKALIQ